MSNEAFHNGHCVLDSYYYKLTKQYKYMLYKIIAKFHSFTTESINNFFGISIANQNLVKLLQNHNVNKIFDIGANTGGYAETLFKNGYNGKIVSFEPLTEAYNKLLLKKDKFNQWKIAERCAIGEHDSEIFINISKNLVSSSILPMLDSHAKYAPQSIYINSEKVKMFKLDTIGPRYIDKDDILFLKMDVQGYEKFVLKGSEKILNKFGGIQLECSLLPLYEGEMLFNESMKYLEKEGFELYDIIPGFRDRTSGRLLQVDCIFFKN
jgi:FkbM family methyltransferase